MIILKASGTYLKRKATQYLIVVIICIAVFAGLALSSIPFSPIFVDLGRYEGVRALCLLLPILIGRSKFRQYSNYKQGFEGEHQVTKSLNSALNDEYYLVNDVNLSDGYGNIDHVVLTPNEVFVIETKNNKGKITCDGDRWAFQYRSKQRSYNRSISYDNFNPSKQAKWNAIRIKKVLDSLEIFKSRSIWIDRIVVFTNKDVDLHINHPTVTILKIQELPMHILTRKPTNPFSPQEMEVVKKEILRLTSYIVKR